MPKSIIGGYQSSFKHSPLFTVVSTIASFVMVITIHHCYGLVCTLYFLLIAGGGIFVLELINYIEHYGLQRDKLQEGNY